MHTDSLFPSKVLHIDWCDLFFSSLGNLVLMLFAKGRLHLNEWEGVLGTLHSL